MIQVAEASKHLVGQNGSTEEKESSDSQGSSVSSKNSEGEKGKNIEKYYIENNSILLRNTNSIDWNDLAIQAEDLYNSWTTITLDLNTLNVSNENVLSYNTNLDNLILLFAFHRSN